jgi:hypothetical protein
MLDPHEAALDNGRDDRAERGRLKAQRPIADEIGLLQLNLPSRVECP